MNRFINMVYSRQLIFRNSALLFCRSIIVLLIGLYTSRVLLEKLGVEDYGVYHVVGSIVLMFGVLRIMFTNAIQRFLNYSKGLEDETQRSRIFNTGFQIQLILAVFFVLFAESIGLYAVYHLNLSEVQLSAASVIYQFTIATTVVSILTVPYDALLMSNERMDVWARISILNSVINLVIIYLISIGPFSKLVNYAILMFVASLIIRSILWFYCRWHFEESKLTWIINKPVMAEMAAFAGWNSLGLVGFTMMHQGVNYLLNLTGGVAVNAARSITYSVMSPINGLVGNVNVAFKPQTNASAVQEDKRLFYMLLGYNAETAFLCFLLLIVPLLIFARQVVSLWLGQMPEHVIDFLLAVSSYYLLRSLHELVNQFFISIGKMKWYQIIEISTMLLILPLAWIMLQNGLPFWTVFAGMAAVEILNHVCTVWLAVKKYAFPIRYFAKKVYLPFILMTSLAFLFVGGAYQFKMNEMESYLQMIVFSVVIEGILIVVAAFLVLSPEERSGAMNVIGQWLRRKSC